MFSINHFVLFLYGLIASFYGLTAVLLGAFGAHKLKTVLDPAQLQSYQTGVSYQFYHAFALLICCLFLQYGSSRWPIYAGACFAIGVLLFSGSIYVLSFKEICPVPTKILGPLTPIGGVFFILGWFFLICLFLTNITRIYNNTN